MRKKNLQRFQSFNHIDITNSYYLVYQPLIRDLKNAVSNYARGKVLDIGCGNKPYLKMFDNNCDEYIGCDIIQSSGNKVDIICKATKIPLEDNTLGTIFCTQVIAHFV